MDIHELRDQIDSIDKHILIALAKRRDIVKKIGILKQKLNLPTKDATRWQEVIHTRMIQGEELGIPEQVISSIWDILHEWSLEVENKHE